VLGDPLPATSFVLVGLAKESCCVASRDSFKNHEREPYKRSNNRARSSKSRRTGGRPDVPFKLREHSGTENLVAERAKEAHPVSVVPLNGIVTVDALRSLR
jgi:hypothetical protein